jgi:hypothetical protein
MDVGPGFDNLDCSTAVEIVFWRPSEEFATRHRNPIFDVSIGISPQSSLTVDLLHALFLGVLLLQCKVVVWFLINAGMWSTIGTMEERFSTSCMAIGIALKTFFRSRKASHPDEDLTRFRVSRKLFGSTAEPSLKTKGAQTWSMCLFLIATLDSAVARFGDEGRRLHESLKALRDFVHSFDGTRNVMTFEQRQDSLSHYKRFLALSSEDDCHTPKRHQIIHLITRIDWFGCPKFYATWLSESLNKKLKAACRTTSQITFDESALLRMYDTLRPVPKRRAIKRALQM